MAKNKINIDEILGEPEPLHFEVVTAFGRDWKIVSGLNHFTLSLAAGGDAGAIGSFIQNATVSEQRAEWTAALKEQRGLEGERLEKLVSSLIEAASKRPTESPSASSRPATKRTSAPRSAARSSSARG